MLTDGINASSMLSDTRKQVVAALPKEAAGPLLNLQPCCAGAFQTKELES